MSSKGHKARMKELLRFRWLHDSLYSGRGRRILKAATFARVTRIPDSILRSKFGIFA